jgi:hypothetical protein
MIAQVFDVETWQTLLPVRNFLERHDIHPPHVVLVEQGHTGIRSQREKHSVIAQHIEDALTLPQKYGAQYNGPVGQCHLDWNVVFWNTMIIHFHGFPFRIV